MKQMSSISSDDGLTQDATKNWVLGHVETFADRVQPNLKADSITQSYEKDPPVT